MNAEYRKRIADLKVLPADKQKEYDETSRRSRDLDRQARKLMATDKAEAEKLAAESKQLSNQAHEIRQSHLKAIGPQIDAISKEQFEATGEVDVEIKLRISANGYRPIHAGRRAEGISPRRCVRRTESKTDRFRLWQVDPARQSIQAGIHRGRNHARAEHRH